MVGSDSSCCLGKYDIYFINVDKNGILVNENFLGTPEDDEGYDLLEYKPDTLVYVGYTRGAGITGTRDIIMGFLDKNGTYLFGRTFGQGMDETAYAMCMTSFEGYAIFGTTNSFGTNYTDFYLLTTDSIGEDQYGVVISSTESAPDSMFVDTSHTLVLSFTEDLTSNGSYISIYPTPAHGEISVEIYTENGNFILDRLDMYDVSGKLIKSILNME